MTRSQRCIPAGTHQIIAREVDASARVPPVRLDAREVRDRPITADIKSRYGAFLSQHLGKNARAMDAREESTQRALSVKRSADLPTLPAY